MALVRLLAAALLAALGASGAPHAPAGDAYAGLSLRDNPEGLVVSHVSFGPFGGDGLRSASLWRGDLIVSVDGQKLDAAGFVALLATKIPGDTLRIVYRRRADAEAHLGDAVPSGDPNGEERTVEVRLEAASGWRGTVGTGLRGDATLGEPPQGEFEARILARAAKAGLREVEGGLDALLAYLRRVQESSLDANSPPLAVWALQRPLSLDAAEGELARQVRAFEKAARTPAEAASAAARLVRGVLDARAPESVDETELAALTERVRADLAERGELARAIVAHHRDDVEIEPERAREALELLRASPELASRALALAYGLAERVSGAEQELAHAPRGVPAELTERVAAAVKGEVLAAFERDGGLCVVGGAGANVYDCAALARIYDRGGADRYAWSARAPGAQQLVFDLAGDDVYESSADFAGPGVATFGLALVDDRGGDDRYETGRRFAQACGLFGLGLILDRKGDDVYSNAGAEGGFAQGVGYWGAGLLVDLDGRDAYTGEKLAQGVGGPRGFGLVLDAGRGDDRYLADGPSFASVYGTPDAFVGFAQGVGYGIRGDAAGGIGALFDLGGDDHYQVGEFGQGCGYFFALGVLHDAAGRDEYLGQRYAQGTGAHQAAGILVDEAGDDRYACKQVAFQGGAWDQTVAWLVDRRGDDVYTGFGLGQGAAAQQALGVLVDAAGADRYESPQAQGESGGNEYHWSAERCLSFSVLLDLGGKDAYSTGRANGAVTTTGARNEADPGASTLYGLAIDE